MVIHINLTHCYSKGIKVSQWYDEVKMKVAESPSREYEAELVERVRLRDRTAMEEFHRVYWDRLYSFVAQHVDGDRVVAEDLVQEIFLVALESLGGFRGDSQLYTWLRSIAYHKVNDFYRRQARECKLGGLPSDLEDVDIGQIVGVEPSPSSALESEETRRTIQQALVDLPGDYQQVLVLKYIEDMPVHQISEVMGRSPKSVEGLLSRARKALRTNVASLL